MHRHEATGDKTVSMKYYLAGPMTGLPDYNFPMFEKVANYLRDIGIDVASPHEIDHGETPETKGQLPYGVYIRAGLKMLLECDGIIMLPNWKDSKGAKIELYVANACDMQLFKFHEETGHVVTLSDWEVAK